jgi:glycogen(starch) synthase
MDNCDHIICVSNLTRKTVIENYHQPYWKVTTVHNAVDPLSPEIDAIKRISGVPEKVVTFLGRITMQKGPEFFVDAATQVIRKTDHIRFIMAGSGDMMDQMIRLVADRGIAHKFHFTGFLRGKQVYEMLKSSDVYVMPSVSEPFGISPLEAMQCGVPSIIYYQSGCSEILHNVIKTDYWDVDAMADAIYSICTYPAMAEHLKIEGKKEVDNIKWEDAGLKVRAIYDMLV